MSEQIFRQIFVEMVSTSISLKCCTQVAHVLLNIDVQGFCYASHGLNVRGHKDVQMKNDVLFDFAQILNKDSKWPPHHPPRRILGCIPQISRQRPVDVRTNIQADFRENDNTFDFAQILHTQHMTSSSSPWKTFAMHPQISRQRPVNIRADIQAGIREKGYPFHSNQILHTDSIWPPHHPPRRKSKGFSSRHLFRLYQLSMESIAKFFKAFNERAICY